MTVVKCQAAARHHCSYLVNIHSTEFLLQQGDEQWLKGVQHAPAKLQRLSEVNRILAHRPWLVTTNHIQVTAHHHPHHMCISSAPITKMYIGALQ